MDQIDQDIEQKVWQRVLAQPQARSGREDLRSLMLAALETAEIYRLLAGMLTGKARERVNGLWEGEQANAACLRGMQRLSGGTAEKGAALRLPKESARRLLEKSYHRTRRAMTEYTSYLADPEFGVVFQQMADRERAHCAVIAQLLGST